MPNCAITFAALQVSMLDWLYCREAEC